MPKVRSKVARFAEAALRVLMLLLALQVSGFGELIEELVTTTCELASCEDDGCPCGPADCPPGCVACHGHGAPALPRAFEDVGAGVAIAAAPESVPVPDASCPPSPELSGLFRPPRAA